MAPAQRVIQGDGVSITVAASGAGSQPAGPIDRPVQADTAAQDTHAGNLAQSAKAVRHSDHRYSWAARGEGANRKRRCGYSFSAAA